MQMIPNKKVAFLLYFTINIVNFIDCLPGDQLMAIPSANNDQVVNVARNANEPSAEAVQSTINYQPITETNAGRSKQYRASAFRGNQPNFRSSYVGSKKSRRVTPANDEVTQSVEVTTEETTLIKSKRKFSNDFTEEIKYNVGPGVNIGVEKEKELVSVYLDEDCLKDVFTGNYISLSDENVSLTFYIASSIE